MERKNQYRKHYYLDEITIIAPGRKKRPTNTSKARKPRPLLQDCQFCDNKEKVVYSYPSNKHRQIKAVKNIYPCIDESYGEANGYQEVIIELPSHQTKISQVTQDGLFSILKAYQDRMKYGLALKNIKYVSIFKNSGQNAGASQEHLHSQMWAMPMIPPKIKNEIEQIKYYKKRNGGNCPVCDFVQWEMIASKRIIANNDKAIAICPYASQYNYEAWFVPKDHLISLLNANEPTLKSLAKQLYSYIYFIEDKGFDYNLTVHDIQNKCGHFYIKFMPRTFPMQIQAGAEIDNGVFVNIVAPEEAKIEYESWINKYDHLLDNLRLIRA